VLASLLSSFRSALRIVGEIPAALLGAAPIRGLLVLAAVFLFAALFAGFGCTLRIVRKASLIALLIFGHGHFLFWLKVKVIHMGRIGARLPIRWSGRETGKTVPVPHAAMSG
jgi:hypothetical protein